MPEKTIREILNSNIISVSPDTPVVEAISIMSSKNISCILVIQDKKPVGIFTERDVVRSLSIGVVYLEKCKISELMNKPVLSASIDMNIYQAYDLLEKNRLRHLAIVNSNGEIVGVVTQTDITNSIGVEYFVEIKEVSKIMTRNVLTFEKKEMVRDAIEEMAKLSISCIVVEENKFPVGILTERDITRIFHKGKDIENLKISEVMSQPIRTISMTTPVYEATRIMSQKKIRRLVIVDKDGKIAGLITQYDIAKKLEMKYIEYLKNIIHEKEKILKKTKRILGEKLIFEHIKHQKLKSLGILAGGIAHDFNNILTAILGNITLAKISTNPESDTFKKLTEAEKASLRAKSLTQQLLTFSKGGAPIKKIVSISKLLEETINFALSGSNIKSNFFISDPLWLVECDEGQISQVINNLIINAKEAMPEGGTVESKVENISLVPEQIPSLPKGKYIKISIKDQGIGIPKKHLQKIFDPYFTIKQKGTGLGLTVAYSIIKKHNGFINVESTLGVGTTFYIYLPAFEKKITHKKKGVRKTFKGRGKILLMDDDEDIRKVTGEILTYLGYNVEFAKDSIEAIELYKKTKESTFPFDVVILDLTVHGSMGGKEAIQRLIDFDPEIKAIVSSGYSNNPIMADFRKYGFSGVVVKPFEVEELSRVLNRLIKE